MTQKASDQQPKPRPVSFFTMHDGRPVEMIYDPEAHMTQFVYLDDNGEPIYLSDFCTDPRDSSLVPYPSHNSFVQSGIVLFPSDIAEYGETQDLLVAVQRFIHRYLDVTPFFEKLAAHYVVFTWVYDGFNELPYLRAIGDFGSGKSRFLKVIGSLCYKAVLASGATTISPIFRLIDEFRGTFVMDEADFNQSDEKAEFVKIFNNGHERGMPVVRSEGSSSGGFNPKAFTIFGPKILAARGYFQDKALESRFITEEMGIRPLRKDIPINLPSDFWKEARGLRNMLLLFRLRNYGKVSAKPELTDWGLEPRLNQIFIPIASIIDDPDIITDLKQLLRDNFQQTVVDRGMSFDGQILEAIISLYQKGIEEPTIGAIQKAFMGKFGSEYSEKQVTAKRLGHRIRSSFKVHTTHTNKGYVIRATEREKIERACIRHGIDHQGHQDQLTDQGTRDQGDGGRVHE